MILREKIKQLENRIDVLEFEKKADGKRFIVEGYKVKFLSKEKDRVISHNFKTWFDSVISVSVYVNHDYIEVKMGYYNIFSSSNDYAMNIYKVNNDELVKVDSTLYYKAYPERLGK